MAGEYYNPENLTGIPHVSLETIEALRLQPFDFEEAYGKLEEENPELARELLIAAEIYTPRNIEMKRAFARGALFLYLHLASSVESTQLNTLLKISTSDGGDGDVSRPPST